MKFIGIDIGTSTICGVIFDIYNKELEVISRQNDATIRTDNDWETLQDPERIFGVVEDILDYFLHKYSVIKGIGITGQMHGILYTDKNGNALGKLINWQDRRGNQTFRDNLSYAKYLTQETGYHVSSGFGLVTHFYNYQNNSIPTKSNKICTIMDYLGMKLTGNSNPVIDTTNAASLGFLDLKSIQFDVEALKKVSIDPNILPEIANSFNPIGLYKNIPIYPAIGDNQAGFLGSVNNFNDAVLINIGTSGQISVFSDDYITNDRLDIRPFPGGGYIIVGASLCGGNSFKILKDFFENTLNLFCKTDGYQENFYSYANSLNILDFDDNKLLQVETLFEGNRMNPDLRGSIKNISTNNFTPQNLIYGFFNGVSNELLYYFKNLPKNIQNKKTSLIGSGNAIRKNNLLCRILEKNFGYKVSIPKNQEEAAFGACLSAIVGGKFIDNFKNAGQFVEYLK